MRWWMPLGTGAQAPSQTAQSQLSYQQIVPSNSSSNLLATVLPASQPVS